ncbi:SpoIIE family protein phosphatase [Uliginosibacterium sp. sgz301328]|uniref:SpoIIE family protein phosphatase n=1 Tax=Uliginosibacterium sp. sgz301328 TaxID=3243764 RepID=UPI00359D782C
MVDDNPGNRALLRAYLTRLGFEALMAENGHQAIRIFKDAAPDIVLMDVMMPFMDGYSAIERIRELPSRRWTPIVIVSAMGAESDLVQGLEAGADDYLTKPLSYKVFAAKMRTLSRMLGFQRAREDAAARERVVSDAVGDGIITFNVEGRIVDCNVAASHLFGVERAAAVDASIAAFIVERERTCFMERFLACVEGQGHADFIGGMREMTAQSLDGRQFPIELRISELDVEEGRLFIAVVRDITERRRIERELATHAQRLQEYHDEAEDEAELAKDLIDRLLRHKHVAAPGVEWVLMPAQRFSGDMVLTGRSPSGRLYGLLADATGHGLAAAVSGLSLANHFYRAVEADLSLHDAVMSINEALRALLPSDRFVSVGLVRLDVAQRYGEVWVGGVPDILLLDGHGKLRRRFASAHLPLGVTGFEPDDCRPATFEWQSGERLLLCSDGVIEATNAAGEMFGARGVDAALAQGGDPLSMLRRGLDDHLQGTAAHDDVSALSLLLS